MVQFWVYSTASLLTCAGLLYYTFLTRQQFYPAVIYLVTSKISVVILGNTGLVLTMLFGRALKTVFLGSLRDAEVEILHENVRYAVTETCLALTIFREEISFHVVVLFTALVFLKCFHWLLQSRIEFIEQSEVVAGVTHFRLITLMGLLGVVDTAFVVLCGMQVFNIGPSVFILFGFEFLILLISLISIALRYVLFVIDTRMDGNWSNKFTYLFYVELVSEVAKLLVYMVFFMLIFTYYGLPLHIVRDLWLSIRNLQLRLISYFRYRRITANLNERFPTPTEEELQETDRTCIICREEMTAEACKKLPCSHIFHVDCLKMWVQRQQTCPTCRATIPSGQRPHVVPETPLQAPEPAVARGAAAQAAAAPAEPPAPFGFPPFHVPAAPAQAQPQAPNAPSPPQVPAAQHPQAAQPGGAPPMQPQPYPMFMPPFMFGAAPFGYGMPPFGFPFGQPMPANGTPGAYPTIDSAAIQRQIEMLQGQLAMLQASAQAFGLANPAVPNAPNSTAASTSSIPSMPSTAIVPPVPVPIPIPVELAQSDEEEEKKEEVDVGPDEGAISMEDEEEKAVDLLEEKMAVPTSVDPQAQVSQDPLLPPTPVEAPIPRAQTEAERRREELRQRYARIYSDRPTPTTTSTTSAVAGNDSDDNTGE